MKSYLDIQLDVVGDGDDMPECKALADQMQIGEKVAFHGRVDRKEVDAFYEAADIFVFPSFREPSGGVVIEAMSYGLPMIVADYGGPGHLVRNSFGIKVSPLNAQRYPMLLAQAVDQLVRDADLRKRFAQAALHHCSSHYLWRAKGETLAAEFRKRIPKIT